MKCYPNLKPTVCIDNQALSDTHQHLISFSNIPRLEILFFGASVKLRRKQISFIELYRTLVKYIY